MPVTLDVDFDPAEWQGFLDAGRAAQAVTDVYLEPAAKFMALGSRMGLSKLLEGRIAGVSVKASGRSARNLFVARLSGGGLHVAAHAVYEGNLTSGNYFIRAGSRPARPRMQTILNWMMSKGMGNFTQANYPNWPALQGSPQLGPGGGSSNARSEAEKIAWAIAGSIKKKGTSVTHKPLFPGGQKRYDYVTFAVRKLRMLDILFSQLRAQGLPGLHRVMVGYWKTGRYNKNSAYNSIRPKLNFP